MCYLRTPGLQPSTSGIIVDSHTPFSRNCDPKNSLKKFILYCVMYCYYILNYLQIHIFQSYTSLLRYYRSYNYRYLSQSAYLKKKKIARFAVDFATIPELKEKLLKITILQDVLLIQTIAKQHCLIVKRLYYFSQVDQRGSQVHCFFEVSNEIKIVLRCRP